MTLTLDGSLGDYALILFAIFLGRLVMLAGDWTYEVLKRVAARARAPHRKGVPPKPRPRPMPRCGSNSFSPTDVCHESAAFQLDTSSGMIWWCVICKKPARRRQREQFESGSNLHEIICESRGIATEATWPSPPSPKAAEP